MPFEIYIGPEYWRPALLAALLSVSLLIALFAYLNSYTRRRYFHIWMVAWLFYALWLILTDRAGQKPMPFLQIAKSWSVGISAIFLFWGSLIFMGQKVSQRLFALLILFLVAWSYVGVYHLENPLQANVPVFAIMGVSSGLAARCFLVYRLRRRFIGATLLSTGFLLWGVFLLGYPIVENIFEIGATIFILAALLQLFIAVSMIILVLEEVRTLRAHALDRAACERAARKGMESRVRSTEQRYQQLFEQASDAIVITTRDDFTILELNERARRLLGVSGELTTGTSLNLFLRRSRDSRANSDTQRLDDFLPGRPMDMVSREGQITSVAVERSAIEMGGQLAFQFVLREFTEQCRLEQQVRQAEKLSALGQMVSGVAHELNNPLAIIKGHLDLILSRVELPESLRTDLAKVVHASNRAAKLVRNFLSFARVHPPQRTAVDLNALVESVVEVRRFDLLVAHTELAMDLQLNLPRITADADQVQQVLINLISNSLHEIIAAARPGKIVIRTRAIESKIVLSVEDNGPGVPAEFQPRIFEPFFTTKETGAGTGLGLSIAHSIMSEHGGRIFYSPSALGGAGFTLEFPRVETCGMPAGTALSSASFVAHATGRVLVLDDEEALAEVLGQMLAHFGHQVVVTFTPLQALDRLRQERFDVVISDFRMPQLDGRDFHEEVRKVNPELASRIVFLTGDVVSRETREFFDSVGNPRLTKPFQMESVARAVDEVLLRRAA
jgi:PAS domain S-box-containing protein